MQTITFKLWDKTQFKCNGVYNVYDFLFDFYGHHLSVLYYSQENAGQNFEGRTKWQSLTFLKIKVMNWFFTIIENAPPLTKQCHLRYFAWKSVQPKFRLYPCRA